MADDANSLGNAGGKKDDGKKVEQNGNNEKQDG